MNGKLRRILPALLALIMIISCFSVAAFAAGDGEDQESTSTRTFELFQVFTGDYSDGTLSNVKWGANGTGTTGTAVDNDTLTTLKNASTSTSDTEKLAVIKDYVNLTNPYAEKTVTKDENGKYVITGVAPGYYLIRDKANTQSGEGSFYTLYVVESTDGTISIDVKGSVPTVVKVIVEDTSSTKTNSASIGDEINFKLTANLPSNLSEYATYYLKFNDTLSTGLTYKTDSLKVTLVNDGSDDQDITKYFWNNASAGSQTINVAIGDVKALANVEGLSVDKDSKIVVTYTAVLNKDAVIKDANENEVTLTYSNDPNNSGEGSKNPPPDNPSEPKPSTPTGESKKSTTETYITAIKITKTDESGNILTGAEFTLTGEGVNMVLVTEYTFKEAEDGTFYKLKDGTYTETAPIPNGQEGYNSDSYESTTVKYKKEVVTTLKGAGQTETNVKGEVDTTGVVTFTGLGAGDYTLSETKTPAGYNTMADLNITIEFDATAKTFSVKDNNNFTYADGLLSVEIENVAGSSLPRTGGIGTTIFYVLGSLMVLCAAVLLISKKRMSHENG